VVKLKLQLLWLVRGSYGRVASAELRICVISVDSDPSSGTLSAAQSIVSGVQGYKALRARCDALQEWILVTHLDTAGER
jgi:hypothetical protein